MLDRIAREPGGPQLLVPAGGGGAFAPGSPGPGGPRPSSAGDGADPGLIGLLAFLATVTMLFLGFTSALMLRRSAPDWQAFAAPPFLLLATALLAASSAALELARRLERRGERQRAWHAVSAAAALGAGFVVAQLGAWRQLADAGVFLASNPSSSFFYVISGAHALHVLGGLAWFPRVLLALGRHAPRPLRLFSIYWHYLGGLWLYLVVLLFWT